MQVISTDESIKRLRRNCGRRIRFRARSTIRAFTFVELLLVLLVIGILAAAAVPTFYESLCRHRLESAARRVKQDLEYLRDVARTKSATMTCEFDEDALRYSFTEQSIRHLDRSEPYSVDLAVSPYVLDSMTADFDGDTSISFDGYGNASADGSVSIGMGGHTRTVALSSATGQIAVTSP